MLAWRRFVPILAITLLTGLGAVLLSAPRIVAAWLPEMLNRAGFKNVSLSVDEVGWTSLSLSDVRLDDAVFAKRLELGFSFLGLTRIEASHLTLKGQTDWEGLTLGPLTLPFAGGNAGPLAEIPDIKLDRARLDLATPLGDIQALVSVEPGEGSSKIRLDLASTGQTKVFSPLILTGIATRDGPVLRFAGRVNDPAHLLNIRLQGSHDSLSATGEARLVLDRIDFALSGLQPDSLFPWISGHLREVSGPLEGDVRLNWHKGKLESAASVGTHGLSFDGMGVRVRNLMGTLTLDRVWPPRTPAHQNFSVGMLTAGVPLGSGSFSFALEDDGAVSIKRATLNLADGKLRLDPTRINPDMTGRLDFQAKDVELGRLAPLMGIEGIALDGVVDGTIPVILDKSGFKVAEASLTARKAGFVRYRPQKLPPALQAGGEGVSLMLAALKDFRFDDLALALDGESGGETTVQFHIKGRNPGLHDGIPFELNFRLTGPLDRLAQQAWGIVSLSEPLEAALDEKKP